MSTKIARGARRHLLALCTHGVSCTLTLHNRMHWPMIRARQGLKELARGETPRIRIVHQSGDVSTWHTLQPDGSYKVSP